MKLVGEVRAVERAMGNSGAKSSTVEKRNFKINIRPASKPDSYYGYGHMQFILHGRELKECGLDLATKLDMYLVPEGMAKPSEAAMQDVQRQLYESEQARSALEVELNRLKDASARTDRERFAAGEERRALQAENVRLTVELMTLKGSLQDFAPPPQMIEG